MDRAQIDAQGLVQRYLAGTLSDAEAQAFEEACLADPALMEELNRDWQLKAGLQELAARGKLQSLLNAPAAAPRASSPARAGSPSWLALAACIVAAVALGLVAWLGTRLADQQRENTQLRASLAQTGAPRVLSSAVRLMSLRGDRVAIELPETGWIGLALDASGLEGETVRVQLTREAGAVVWEQSHTVPGEGTLFVVMDSAQLQPGDYDLALQPAVTGTPKVFHIRALRRSAR